MESYRKIGIGNAENMMYYQVGSRIRDFKVSDIILRNDDFVIFLEKGDEKQEWKCYHNSLVTIKEKSLID